MRIIAGEHRGRRIEAPPGKTTRPMLDRVREALFSTLGNLVEDSRVLDLFAGTGSLGLEALSRGASSARMIERDRDTLRLLRENVDALGLADRAEIVQADALTRLAWRSGEGDEPTRYELIFLDPPYPLTEDARGRARLVGVLHELLARHLQPGGLLVLHARRSKLRREDLAPARAELREYGTNAIWYLHATPSAEAAP